MKQQHKFEAVILNQIYNTNVFSEELSSEDFDYSPFLSEYIKFQKANNFHENFEKNPLVQEIIEIARFISNPKNFSCYEQLYKLRGFLEQHPNFSFILNQEETNYSVIDVIVFSALHNCKLWSKLYRPGHFKKNKQPRENYDKCQENKEKHEKNNKNTEGEDEKIEEFKEKAENHEKEEKDNEKNQKLTPLAKLFEWFFIFEATFTDLIKYRFNPSLLDPKNKKRQERLSKLKKRNPEFINAVKDQDYHKVEELLKQGIDIKVVDSEDGGSAGHIACRKGNLALCKLLDQYKINWESEDLESITPVFHAIESANIELISYLFEEKKVNFEHNDFQNRTPFYHACCFGNLTVINYLYFTCHCNPNTKSYKNRTALSKACFLAKHEVVRFLLSLPKKDFPVLDDIDDKGRTALHNASWGPAGGKEGKFLNGELIYDCPEAAEMLIEKGATVDFSDFDGNTPFIIAAASEGVKTLRLLFKCGAFVNKKNKKGETAVFNACKFGHMNSLKILIEEMGCDLTLKTLEGESNLVGCLMNDQWTAFDYLKGKETGNKKKEEYQMDLSYILKNKPEAKNFEALEKFVNFMKESQISLEFLPEYSRILAGFKHRDNFLFFFEYFLPQMSRNQKETLFYQILENNKLPYLQLFEKNNELFMAEFTPDHTLIISLFKSKSLSFELLANLLFESNFDIFNVPNLLHFIVDSRKMSLVIALRKLFTSDASLKTRNRFINFLVSQPKEVQNLQISEFLLRIDPKTEMNCFEYARFKKFFDIEKVLKDLADNFLTNSELNTEHYHIPYKLVEKASKIIDYVHEKRVFLDNFNQNLLEFDSPCLQYQVKTASEEEFFKKILKDPFSFDKTNSFFYIKTEEELIRMALDIEKYSVFGVDLEFLTRVVGDSLVEGQDLASMEMPSNSGFVCTLQISTIDKDYIVDAIYLREKIPVYLKGMFEDFNKIKLFHGSDYDLQWLKVDFEINLVNMFDTARGYMILNQDKNAVSLAKLSEIYLNLTLDKSFQTSFWGMRPLPKVMLDYARLDSRVLMGLFPCILRELKEKGSEKQMASACNRVCWEKVEKIKWQKTQFLVTEGETEKK